ncbi:Mitochondrial presequence protease, partial [Physocladia obscura]
YVLTPEIFLVKDGTTPIIFKGVVYNEMKGVFSDVNNIFLTRLQQAMYPGTTYGVVSGGDPANITDLSYEELVAFHRKYYHPSNAKFVTYGNFPLIPRLAGVDSIITPFGKIETESITDVKPFNAPVRVSTSCSPDPMGNPEKQAKLSISYLTNDATDTFETFAVRMLTTLLTDGPSSPMYRALIESNIGTDYAASTGYDPTAKMTNFSVGLQGISATDFSLVEKKIKEAFIEVAENGFEQARVESAIHQLELGIRHRRGNFGMGLSQSAIQRWVHGGDPVDALDVAKEPSSKFSDEVQQEEKIRLQRKIESLSVHEKEEILADGAKLVQMQETKEDPSCLPTLTLADVPVKGKTYPILHIISSDDSVVPIQVRETDTNGISYISIAKSLDGIEKDLLNYLPLYSSSLTALGTQKTSSVPELDDKIRSTTSGINSSVSVQIKPTDNHTQENNRHQQHSLSIQFGTSYLDINRTKAFELLQDVVQGPPGGALSPETKERLRTVIAGMAADGMNSLAGSGHRYAASVCAADLSEASKLKQALGGVESIVFWNRLHEMGDKGVEGTFEKIQAISRFILESKTDSKALVISSKDVVGKNTAAVADFTKELMWGREFAPSFKNTFIPLPFTVNYTARMFLGVGYSHRDSPALQILAELITSHFLHREVREKGGAYGGFGTYNALEGLFSMASYRDPPGAGKRTLNAYDRAALWAAEISKHLGERELDEAKLSIISAMDAPISASQEGTTFFTTLLTDEVRQARRELMLGTTLAHVQQVAQDYVASHPFSQAVLGPAAEGLDAEGWNIRSMQD